MKLDLKREHQIYRTKNGQRVPGVTTILGVLSKPQLLRWYAAMEREGILDVVKQHELEYGDCPDGPEILAASPKPNEKGEPVYFAEVRRDKAASLGTITHARIEAWLRGEALEADDLPADLYAQSVNGFDRFRRWWDGHGLKFVASEFQMVSEAMQVGGTMDVLASSAEHGTVVVDIKSSKSSQWWPYKEVKSQAQTYGRIWSEIHVETVHEVWVYRCGTTPDDRGQEYRLTEKDRAAGDRLFDGALTCYLAARDLE